MPAETTVEGFLLAAAELVKGARTGIQGAEIAHATIAPEVAAAKLLEQRKWPAAVLTDAGGQVDQFNGRVRRGVLDVTVITKAVKDAVGELDTVRLLQMGAAVAKLFEWNLAIAVFVVPADESDAQTVRSEAGDVLCVKTWRFDYEIVTPVQVAPEVEE